MITNDIILNVDAMHEVKVAMHFSILMKMVKFKVLNIFIKEKLLKRNLEFINFMKPNYGRYFIISVKPSAKVCFFRSVMGLRNLLTRS